MIDLWHFDLGLALFRDLATKRKVTRLAAAAAAAAAADAQSQSLGPVLFRDLATKRKVTRPAAAAADARNQSNKAESNEASSSSSNSSSSSSSRCPKPKQQSEEKSNKNDNNRDLPTIEELLLTKPQEQGFITGDQSPEKMGRVEEVASEKRDRDLPTIEELLLTKLQEQGFITGDQSPEKMGRVEEFVMAYQSRRLPLTPRFLEEFGRGNIHGVDGVTLQEMLAHEKLGLQSFQQQPQLGTEQAHDILRHKGNVKAEQHLLEFFPKLILASKRLQIFSSTFTMIWD
ncbi:hypothetical protein B7494_g8504 [Chlorociboria aeruginascens]|nr:hypothetical protein B7494_g8504 [Chlorociboria aeruginascens]